MVQLTDQWFSVVSTDIMETQIVQYEVKSFVQTLNTYLLNPLRVLASVGCSSFQVTPGPAVLFRYTPHYGIIMHTSFLPIGQRSRLKEVIQCKSAAI